MYCKAIGYTMLLSAAMSLGNTRFAYAQLDDAALDQSHNECLCDILYIDQPILAAGESGILIEIASEGTEVTNDQIVARTDDKDALLRRDAAYYTWQSIVKDNASDIRRRYAVANYKAAAAAYRQVVEANLRSPKAVSQAELDRRKLEMEAAKLSIENEEHEREISKISVRKDEAEYKLSTAMAMRHRIKSPITGVVTERLKEVGEFVQAGEEVVKLVRLDRLRAVGHVPLRLMTPSQAKGRSVDIAIQVGDEKQYVSGTIFHSDTTVTTGDEFDVWIEFQNPEGFPIRPGMHGTMIIQ
jgi:multidrug efflux pump subunit AcrA (membrane-fusion protein)